MVLHLGHTQVVDKQPRRAPKIATRVWRVSPPVGWIGRWSPKSLVPKILHIDFGLESRACATRRHGSWHCGTIHRRASSLYVPRPSRCSKLVCSHELIVLFFFVRPSTSPTHPFPEYTPSDLARKACNVNSSPRDALRITPQDVCQQLSWHAVAKNKGLRPGRVLCATEMLRLKSKLLQSPQRRFHAGAFLDSPPTHTNCLARLQPTAAALFENIIPKEFDTQDASFVSGLA